MFSILWCWCWCSNRAKCLCRSSPLNSIHAWLFLELCVYFRVAHFYFLFSFVLVSGSVLSVVLFVCFLFGFPCFSFNFPYLVSFSSWRDVFFFFAPYFSAICNAFVEFQPSEMRFGSNSFSHLLLFRLPFFCLLLFVGRMFVTEYPLLHFQEPYSKCFDKFPMFLW